MATNAQPIAVIARLLDLSERRVQQLSREGVIPKAERGQYDLVGAVRGYVAYLREQAVRAQAGAPDFGLERARLIRAKADIAEMEADGRRGELLPATRSRRPGRPCWRGCGPGSLCCPTGWRRSATRRRRLPAHATRSARRSTRRSTSSQQRRSSSSLILTGPERLAEAARRALSILRPPPELTISDWADANRRLSSEASAEPGRWRTSRAEYQRGMMDAISDASVESVVIMSSVQTGKSESLLNVVGFHIDQDPAPMMVVMPTERDAEAWSKDRFSPMARDTPCLVGRISDPKSRDGSNKILHKRFPGGHLTIVGANAPSGLASRPIRILLCDEVDRYPFSAGAEGDPVNLAKKRTVTFWNRKIVLVSTPSIRGLSRIETAYAESDQRQYWVPWARRQGAAQVAPIKGVEGFNRASPVSGPTYVDATERGKRVRRGARLWTVAVSTFKAETYRFLRLERPTGEERASGAAFPAGTVHLPDWVESEWLKQFIAEQLVTVKTKRGFARLEWQKLRERNEALDCRVYARAAAWIVGADRWAEARWADLEAQLGTNRAEEAADISEASAGAIRPVSRPLRRRSVPSSYMR